MKRIEDAEVRAKFDEAMAEIPVMIDRNDLQKLYQHLFQAGRDSLVKELMDVEAIAARKPKRTIAEVHRIGDSFFVVSDDRKMFHWQGNQMGWYALTDLPQED